MRVNELLTNIKNDVPITLKIDAFEIDAVVFQGIKCLVCSSEDYTKGKKIYGNAIVTNVGIEDASILIEAETAMGGWTKKE